MARGLKTFCYILTALVSVSVAACDGGIQQGAVDSKEAVSETRVSVEEFKYNHLPGGSRVLSGKLRNSTGEHIRNAQIIVSLYDGDNRRISMMRIDVKDVEPGSDKAFRETVDSDLDVRGAKVRSVLLL